MDVGVLIKRWCASARLGNEEVIGRWWHSSTLYLVYCGESDDNATVDTDTSSWFKTPRPVIQSAAKQNHEP